MKRNMNIIFHAIFPARVPLVTRSRPIVRSESLLLPRLGFALIVRSSPTITAQSAAASQ